MCSEMYFTIFVQVSFSFRFHWWIVEKLFPSNHVCVCAAQLWLCSLVPIFVACVCLLVPIFVANCVAQLWLCLLVPIFVPRLKRQKIQFGPESTLGWGSQWNSNYSGQNLSKTSRSKCLQSHHFLEIVEYRAWKEKMLYLQLISNMSIEGALLWSHQCSELTVRAKKGHKAQYWFTSNISSLSMLPSYNTLAPHSSEST